MENDLIKEEIHKREHRCEFCKHVDTTDGYCYKHNKNCWEIDWCDDFEIYID